MKIYFIDGYLTDDVYFKFADQCDCACRSMIDAAGGYTNSLDELKREIDAYGRENYAVLTNCLWLIEGYYTFNSESGRHELYIWDPKERAFVWVHDIYQNIRPSNNLEKMYKAGMFAPLSYANFSKYWSEKEET